MDRTNKGTFDSCFLVCNVTTQGPNPGVPQSKAVKGFFLVITLSSVLDLVGVGYGEVLGVLSVWGPFGPFGPLGTMLGT